MTVDKLIFKAPVTGTSSENAGIVVGSIQVGGQDTLLIADMSTRDLLEGIFIELKKLNLRQEEAFGEPINDEDISR